MNPIATVLIVKRTIYAKFDCQAETYRLRQAGIGPGGAVDALTVFIDCGTITGMSLTFDKAQSLVASLPRQDRARLFVWMAAEIADQLPGIEFDPRVCGGSARIGGTRIPAWSLQSWKRLEDSDEEILRNHPSLKVSDWLNAWQYVARHQGEIDREISENQNEAENDSGG